MNVAVMKTKAELALGEQFASVAPRLPGGAWMRKLRAEAMGTFAAVGLPHRRIEEWKYTDLRDRLKEFPEPAVDEAIEVAAGELEVALGPLAAVPGPRLVFVNGSYRSGLSRTAGLSAFTAGNGAGEAAVRPLSAALAEEKPEPGARLKSLLEAQAASERGPVDVPAILNTAFVTDGAVVSVAAGVEPPHPLHLVFVCAGPAARTVTVRNVLEIGRGARVVGLETYVALAGAPHQVNALTQAAIGEESEVSHVKAVLRGGSAAHLSTWSVGIGAGARYRGFQLTSGVELARNQLFVAFKGQHASVDLSGVLLGRGAEHIDTTLLVDHAVPHGTSRELFKGVLDGRARGVFQGKLIVRPGAQKTDGKQMAQGLMLSPEAEFDSKPELEIYADDVACGHGSTCAEIDPELVFYLRARGIPEAEARALLVEAFAAEAIEKVESEPVREALLDIARRWLAEGAARRSGGGR
jgi:Fe-S cluster assembly protein SufD